jgi:triacylglycerol lipase
MNIPRLRSPIVLVHGLFGFNRLQVAGATLAKYFPGIPEVLQSAGNRVLIPALAPTGGIAQRARQLKDFLLKSSPGEPVHLLAHSMGGLDARYLISCLDMADRVLTLTTIGTPHHGTSFADWGVARLARLFTPVFDTLGMPYQSFYDLCRDRCKAFNQQVKDRPAVRYFSVAGKHDGHLLQPEWLLPYHIVLRQEGENDGIVSVASASYGETCDTWDGDHIQLVGWYHPVAHLRGAWKDPAPRYAALVRRLADFGY